jgi:hypothetical protein
MLAAGYSRQLCRSCPMRAWGRPSSSLITPPSTPRLSRSEKTLAHRVQLEQGEGQVVLGIDAGPGEQDLLHVASGA